MGKFGLFDDGNPKQGHKTPENVKIPRTPSKSLERIKDTWNVRPYPKSPSRVTTAMPSSTAIKPVVVEPIKIIHKNKEMEDDVENTLALIAKLEKDWFAEQETIKKEAEDQLKRQKEEEKAKAEAALKAKKDLEQTKLAQAEQQKVKTPVKPETLPPTTGISKQSPLQILPSKTDSAKPITTKPVVQPSQQHVNTKQPPREVGTKLALENSASILKKLEETKTLKKSLPQQFQNQLLRDKMKINRTVGQLTNSQKKVVPLIKDLNQLFMNSQSQPEYYRILLYLCAKKIVKQAEMEVAVKQESCFPIAILVVHLSNKHPEFNPILVGRMMKKCPYIVPCYPRKQAEESKEAYQARLGYNMKGSNVETEIQFGERMGGIVKLYAAIVQTDSIANNYGIKHGWTWLARIMNMKPRKLTPLLIHAFLNVAGHALVAKYNTHMIKLMKCLLEDFIPMFPQQALPSTTKLKLFLEETVMLNGQFPIPDGQKMLP